MFCEGLLTSLVRKEESMATPHTRVQYLKDVLGIRSVLMPEQISTPQIAGIVEQAQPVAELQYQTFNDGPFIFVSWSEEQKKYSIEELQLLEKIIFALKIPFQKTSIAVLPIEKSMLTLSEIRKVTRGYPYVFLMGQVWSELLKISYGEERTIENQTYYLTFDPKDLMENQDNKKTAWNQFKQIMPNLQNILKGQKAHS